LYVKLPSNLVKSISQPPGKGGAVVKMTQVTAAQIPLEQNTTWQEVNRQLKVNLQLLVYTVGDYPVKLSTVIASGELPDMFTAQSAVFPQFVQFLEASCADLTPYLAGDAIRAYPNLANYPAYVWHNAVFNGKIYGLSAPAGTYLGYGLLTKQPYMDQAGVKMGDIKSADDFMRAAKLLTIPGKRWAVGWWHQPRQPGDHFQAGVWGAQTSGGTTAADSSRTSRHRSTARRLPTVATSGTPASYIPICRAWTVSPLRPPSTTQAT
jgi:ABC-type glycerol-3-phosphate transport system substrate-binding protein